MGKQVFGEYAAFDSGKGIRYQKNNKLVSEGAVPPEVVAYLKSKLATQTPEPAPAEPKFPKPSPEELAKMRADSLKVAPELALTPEEEAARASQPVPEPQPADQPPLEEGDFDEPEPLTDDQIADIGASTKPDFTADSNDFLETVSIYTADIKDIAQALYDRFGVYTIYLNTTPQTDEINPLTGESFTRYHQGIAYQALVKARNSGFFNRNPEIAKGNITEGRVAHENYTREAGDPRLAPAPEVDATQAAPNSFAYRTSPAFDNPGQTHYIAHEPDPVTGELRAVQREIPRVAQHQGKVNNARQRFDANQDEMVVEPQFGQQVIRPNW